MAFLSRQDQVVKALHDFAEEWGLPNGIHTEELHEWHEGPPSRAAQRVGRRLKGGTLRSARKGCAPLVISYERGTFWLREDKKDQPDALKTDPAVV